MKRRNREEISNLSASNHEMIEIKKLERSLFGSMHSPPFGAGQQAGDGGDTNSLSFFLDKSGAWGSSMNEEVVDLAEDQPTILRPSNKLHFLDGQRKPKWVDEEEETCKINIASVNKLRKLRKSESESVISGSEYLSRLRAQHIKMNPGTEWAHTESGKMDWGEDSDEENSCVEEFNDVMHTNDDFVRKSSSRLPPGILDYLSIKVMDTSKKGINSVQFHRNAQIILTAGKESCFNLCHFFGESKIRMDKKIVPGFIIRKASFLPDGSEVILAGSKNKFYAYDLWQDRLIESGTFEEKSFESFEVSPDSTKIAFVGDEGRILMVSSKTKQLINTLKMNGNVQSVSFTSDGLELMSFGGDGHIYHWDLRMGKCFHIGVDEGCLEGTFLCTAPKGNLFAAGSSCGIVNLYDKGVVFGSHEKQEDNCVGRREHKCKPIKTFENLTTRVSFMRFNHDAQILAICSRMKKNSLRLIHVPSYSVFSDWPPLKGGLTFSCLDFSPMGGFIAVGNTKGGVSLYRLPHYHCA